MYLGELEHGAGEEEQKIERKKKNGHLFDVGIAL